MAVGYKTIGQTKSFEQDILDIQLRDEFSNSASQSAYDGIVLKG